MIKFDTKEAAAFESFVSSAIKAKELHRVASQDGFTERLQALSLYAMGEEPIYRLRAVALICKIGLLVKALRPNTSQALTPLLREELIPFNTLADPDERYYLASFWRFAQPVWAARYFAVSIANEESAESARIELSGGLLFMSADVSTALRELVAALCALRFDTEEASASRARRIRRCAEATRKALHDSTVSDLGENFGVPLRDLARSVSKSSSTKIEEKAFQEAAEGLIQLVNEVVRMRLRAAFEPQAFSIYYSIRDWFDKRSWLTFIERDIVLQSKRDLLDSIEVLARSGRADKSLTQLLKLISVDEQEFHTEIEQIILRNEGLTSEVVAWLRGAPVIDQSTQSEANEVLRLENLIARLILAAEEGKRRTMPPRPEQEPEIARLISALALERRLQLFGSPGTVVEYSALEHEAISAEVVGQRSVVLTRPGIVGRTTDGRRRIVVRALVDKV